ncbi:MAG: NAD-binding protein [Planctomycetes bacterium]|nr:NAD-binding protein [Planctomycetota bacterium]
MKLENHILLIADPSLMLTVSRNLRREGVPCVCISKQRIGLLPPAIGQKLKDVPCRFGDPCRSEVLEAAGIRKAQSIIIALPEDTKNLHVLVTARCLAPGVRAIVMVNRAGTEEKLRSAGAAIVISRQKVLSSMIMRSRDACVAGFVDWLQAGNHDAGLLRDMHVDSGMKGKLVREVFPAAIAVYRNLDFRFDIAGLRLMEDDVVVVPEGSKPGKPHG